MKKFAVLGLMAAAALAAPVLNLDLAKQLAHEARAKVFADAAIKLLPNLKPTGARLEEASPAKRAQAKQIAVEARAKVIADEAKKNHKNLRPTGVKFAEISSNLVAKAKQIAVEARAKVIADAAVAHRQNLKPTGVKLVEESGLTSSSLQNQKSKLNTPSADSRSDKTMINLQKNKLQKVPVDPRVDTKLIKNIKLKPLTRLDEESGLTPSVLQDKKSKLNTPSSDARSDKNMIKLQKKKLQNVPVDPRVDTKLIKNIKLKPVVQLAEESGFIRNTFNKVKGHVKNLKNKFFGPKTPVAQPAQEEETQ